MDAELEERYFNWLYNKVVLEQVPSPNCRYLSLFRKLHTTEFVWYISGDDNRAEYGKELRRSFSYETRTPITDAWVDEPASVLEVLIAFADIAEFETDEPRSQWFWIFLENLGLSGFNDAAYYDLFDDAHIDEILHKFINRTYDRNGNGGLFPLRHADRDQRKVEIWYQFCAYIAERHLV